MRGVHVTRAVIMTGTRMNQAAIATQTINKYGERC